MLAEALRNLRAHILLSVLSAAAVFLVATTALAGSAHDVEVALDQHDALTLRGLNVLVVAPKSQNGEFTAQRCDELNQLDAVKAAGAVMTSVSSQPLTGPGIQIEYGTPRLANIYWPNVVPAAGTIVGARVAETYGLQSASTWAVRIGFDYENLHTTTAPSTPRNPSWDGTVVVPKEPRGQTRVCWVEAATGHRDGVEALLLGWWGRTEVNVAPMLDGESSGTPQSVLSGRLSQYFPVFGGLVAIAALLVNWVIRRSEFALYSLEGLRRPQLLWQASVDVILLAYLPAIVSTLATLTALVLTSSHSLTLSILAMDAARIMCAILISPPLALLVIGTKNAVSRLKGQ